MTLEAMGEPSVCGWGIQWQSIWGAGLSGLSRSSNHTNEIDEGTR
jgi:hypothetical protein